MTDFVIKRDGTKEPFDEEKVRRGLTFAAQRAGLSEDRIVEVVDQIVDVISAFVSGKEEVTTAEIREKGLSELDRIEPSVAESVRNYNKEKGKA